VIAAVASFESDAVTGAAFVVGVRVGSRVRVRVGKWLILTLGSEAEPKKAQESIVRIKIKMTATADRLSQLLFS
jgi:hypothetical protein